MKQSLFEKAPPHAIEAEMSLLGSMLIDPDTMPDIIETISGSKDFYDPRHAEIYEKASSLIEEQGSVDMVRLVQRLTDAKTLENVGGIEYITDLFEAVPSAANAQWYAKIVKEKSDLRRIIETSSDAISSCFNDVPASQIADNVGQVYLDIGDPHRGKFESGMDDMMVQLMKDIELRERGSMTGIPCMFKDMDSILNGLHRGELIIVAARPSQGKTALALNMSENIASTGMSVGFLSLEMTREGLASRMLSSLSGVDAGRMRKNILSTNDYAALTAAAKKLSNMPIQIDDTPSMSLTQVRAKARRMKKKFGIEILFVDYLQLMSGRKARYSSRQEEVSDISRGVKAIARELSIPVVCLSQLNRGNEAREDKRPRMSDLRESGAIEQDADVIMMIHREDYYHKAEASYMPNNTAEVIIEKQRNGPTGIVKLYFESSTTRFKPLGIT